MRGGCAIGEVGYDGLVGLGIATVGWILMGW